MAKIIQYISQGEILAQMAEELTEAAQAALKLRRALENLNPTPKTIPECWEQLEEETGDVMNCIDALLLEDSQNYHAFMCKCGEKAEPKMSRWKQRLEERYAKNDDDAVQRLPRPTPDLPRQLPQVRRVQAPAESAADPHQRAQ